MKRAEFSIFDWLYYYRNSAEYSEFLQLLTLSGTYNETAVNIATGAEAAEMLEYYFAERKFSLPFSDPTLPADAMMAQRASDLFTLWKSTTLGNFIRAFYALGLEYNPLDNYNGLETTETEYGKSTDTEYGKTDTFTNGRRAERSTSDFGYNSINPAPTMQETEQLSGDDVRALSGKDTVSDSGKDTVTVTKAGNLGITTSQQMLNSEVELRKKNFVKAVIKAFVDEYTIY